MKKIVLVHGINNQGKSSKQIIEEWIGALKTTLSPRQIDTIDNLNIVAPYYGNVLYEFTENRVELVNKPVAQNIEVIPSEETNFYNDFLNEVALEFGISEEDILREMKAGDDAIEQSLLHNRKFISFVKLLEGISPWQGKHMIKLIAQAYCYINNEDAAEAVDKIVSPDLKAEEPALILGHSLGTIVTYKILRDIDRDRRHKFLTLGSPLGIKAVKNGIGPRFEKPKSVSDWSNGLDKDDFVSFKRKLSKADYTGIINEHDAIDNGKENPHSIENYLKDPWVVNTILEYLEIE